MRAQRVTPGRRPVDLRVGTCGWAFEDWRYSNRPLTLFD